MTAPDEATITRLLNAAAGGDDGSREEVYRLVYDEIVGLAEALLRREPVLRDRAPESLAHEAWRRVDGIDKTNWVCRREFYGYLRRAMWTTIIDWARSKRRRPHVGALGSWIAELRVASAEELVAIEDALVRLGRENARVEQVVRGRFIEDLTEQEVADRLGVSRRTVQNDWVFARTWLHRVISSRRDETA